MRFWQVGALVAAVAGIGWWWASGAGGHDPVEVVASASAPASASPDAGSAVRTVARPPFRTSAQAQEAFARDAELQRWRQRLERATATLQTYQASTRYPFDSRPAAEQPDQLRPNDPVVEEGAVTGPRGAVGEQDGLRLRTSQDRVFVQGRESVRFSVSLLDASGRPQPLRVVRAAAREVPAVNAAATHADVPMNFNDDGTAGDLAAGDRSHGAVLQPSTQGFGDLLGQIRVDVYLEVKGQPAHTYFDILYSPKPPATWQGGVRETLDDGSLNLVLTANVEQAGRYVVTGRIDDARGQPFALVRFNEELAPGVQPVRLQVFGKLIRDAQPAFPLTLRDVDGFLLREDAFPDRVLMPRLNGPVHVTARHPLTAFSDAEWTSEERERYLAELNRDVSEARREVDRLTPRP